ncbi:MAG TPA: DUF1802 family protein [Abditibacterium sp.]|jgi:hypothetical protein
MPETITCNAILKEWAITCAALAQGRQIILLRKGGLLDEDGSFSLEHGQFLLLPTYLHQETALVKPEHQDLFDFARPEVDESARTAYLRHFARVEALWQLGPRDSALLQIAPHIWSNAYLDLRFGYQSDKPLFCAALRVYELETPLRYELAATERGCRSWIDTSAPLESGVTPVQDDVSFGEALDELSELFR